MLAFDPLPGNEERTCRWIEKWGAGIWIEKPEDLAPKIQSCWRIPPSLPPFATRPARWRRLNAARDGALATLEFLSRKVQPAPRP